MFSGKVGIWVGDEGVVDEGKWEMNWFSVYMLRIFDIPVDHQQPETGDKQCTKAFISIQQKIPTSFRNKNRLSQL